MRIALPTRFTLLLLDAGRIGERILMARKSRAVGKFVPAWQNASMDGVSETLRIAFCFCSRSNCAPTTRPPAATNSFSGIAIGLACLRIEIFKVDANGFVFAAEKCIQDGGVEVSSAPVS